MRELTAHKANGLNEAIRIFVTDEPGPGGAHHAYELIGAGPTVRIEFQKGPIKEAGYNGLSNEALLAIVADRLECFQRGPFKCKDNEDALSMVKGGLTCLLKRTKARVAQGVEGTNVQHAETVSDDELKVGELLRANERLRREYDELSAKYTALVKLVGEPPAGSHPDEMLPRAPTWHGERANWEAEVARLREHVATLEAKIADPNPVLSGVLRELNANASASGAVEHMGGVIRDEERDPGAHDMGR